MSEAESVRLERPDYTSRSPEGLARIFEHFGVEEAPQIGGRLYEALCREIAEDPLLLSLAAGSPPTQPPPNLLFAAVHYLLLRGAVHPLRDYYPILCQQAAEPREPLPALRAFPHFRDFCLAHRREIETLVLNGLTQTNVIQRCTGLLPAFAEVFERGGQRPLALVEIGPSAGLNLQWDRYRYTYRGPEGDPVVRWGELGSAVAVEAGLRGSGRLRALPDAIPVASRLGIELHPIDLTDDHAVTWLRALIWPEHVGRQERLTAAIRLAREHPPTIVPGDAAEALPGAIEAAPDAATLCVYGTHTLYQFPRDALRALFRALKRAGARRPVFFVSAEGTGDRCSELRLTEYGADGFETTLLARCCPHGRWLDWLGAKAPA